MFLLALQLILDVLHNTYVSLAHATKLYNTCRLFIYLIFNWLTKDASKQISALSNLALPDLDLLWAESSPRRSA